MTCFRLTVALGISLGVAAPARAEKPDDSKLVGAGAAMGVPMYFAVVAQHEGSHALVAKLYGRTITRMSLLPGFHPVNRRFYFGYVSYRPSLPVGKRTFVLLAPKLVNLMWLGGYATLLATDTLPANHYAQLAMATWALSQWVDLSKDVVLFWRPHDINVALRINGASTFWKRAPWKLLHLALSISAGYFVLRGIERTFDDDAGSASRLVPVLTGAF